MEAISKFGKTWHCGPGVKIGRAIANDDNKSALYAIEIWDKLKMYAAVEKKR